MPSKKRKYNARFPAGRIKKIMQTDEEVGKVAQAVPVIISRTLELFVESLLTKAMEVTNAKNAKTLSTSHMKQCILSESRFDFLKDLVKNIPDINSEDNIIEPNQSTTLTNIQSDNSKQVTTPIVPVIVNQPHCSSNNSKNSSRRDSITSTITDIQNKIHTNVQIQAAVNTNYSANFYTEQQTSATAAMVVGASSPSSAAVTPLSSVTSVIQYNRNISTPSTEQNIEHRTVTTPVKINLAGSSTTLFQINPEPSSKINDIPPLIPLMRQPNESNFYCPPSDNLCIDEDYDN